MLGKRKILSATVVAVAAVAAVSLSSVASSRTLRTKAHVTIAPAPGFTASDLTANPAANWLEPLGDLNGNGYSSLNQINTSNVSTLQSAWQTHFADPACKSGTSCGTPENNPLVYNGVMYLNDPHGSLDALDATTGQRIWQFVPQYAAGTPATGSPRGIAMGDGLIFEDGTDGSLIAVSMMTGRLVWSANLGNRQLGYNVDGSPLFYDNMVIVGESGGDQANSDYINALDADTGQILWHFNVVPTPGTPGYNTWANPNNYHAGGGAVWETQMSVDPKLGLLYAGTGNPIPWNYTGPGKELYTESVVALNVHTGQLKWYYQTVHHDIWDDDMMNGPILFNGKFRPYKILKAGKLVNDGIPKGSKVKYTGPAVEQPALSIATKMGYLFILNRKTGQPLIPTPEMKLTKTIAALHESPTEPMPSGQQFTNPCYTSAYDQSQWPQPAPDGTQWVFGCNFSPYDDQFNIVTPHDSIDWPTMSVDPTKAVEYVCASNDRGGSIRALPQAQDQAQNGLVGAGEGAVQHTASPKYGRGVAYGDRGELVAMNLTNNRVMWRTYLATNSGPCYSGAMSTAGGVVFLGQNNGSLEAFDANSGAVLWQSSPEPSGANSKAITYSVNGTQYVSIFTGGDGHESVPSGDLIQTFALP